MSISIYNWINPLVNSSKCKFPDCKNESSCQCSKCLKIYCYAHIQIHFGFCNNLNEVPAIGKEPTNYIDGIDKLQSLENICLSKYL
jgi:hypothetical protein